MQPDYNVNNEKNKNMKLNISKGDMYESVDYTGNAVKGRCLHNCSYCYMKDMGVFFPIKLDEYELRGDMQPYGIKKIAGMKDLFEESKFIFIGSGTDLFANDVPKEWIIKTLNYCDEFDNKYLFQTKNPKRLIDFLNHPVFKKAIACTTIETNEFNKFMGQAPSIESRVLAMEEIYNLGIETHVTIEPIMKFNLEKMVELIKRCKPSFVNIGANTSHERIKLPEPTKDEILDLIEELSSFTRVVQKSNLRRLLD